jgi:steroid 5-alpha reductase family enzyme
MLVDLLILLGVALGINLAMFFIAFRFQTDKLTDISYALTFIVLVLVILFTTNWQSSMKVAAVGMVCLWAIRLGGFLLYRVHKSGKDSRFNALRSDFKKFLQFWVLQGISVWVILLPTLLLLSGQHTLAGPLTIIGVWIWAAGLVIEATADLQKYRFTSNSANKNKWIDQGIWKYSRHPNYFGEILVWVGMYLLAASSLSIPLTVIGIVSPLFVISLLLFVSGIPKLEQSADRRWGDNKDYREYKRRTSILIPAQKAPIE